MRKLILKMSISVDGFVGGPNGEIDWIFKSLDDGAIKWIVDTLWQAGVHIMGSCTFHDMVAYWPTSSEPFAPPMNQIPKAVFSRGGIRADVPRGDLTTRALKDATLHHSTVIPQSASAIVPAGAAWNEARIINGGLVEEIARLKQEPGKDILAHGGAGFAQSLAAHGLIDEYRLLTHPVALGRGKPLFANLPKPLDLKFKSSSTFDSGAIAHIYRPA
jgi:dihydrofolate reductase